MRASVAALRQSRKGPARPVRVQLSTPQESESVMSRVNEVTRCVACKVLGCDDIASCKLRQEVQRAGDALDAWNDGAVFSAILAGVEFDTYEARLHADYEKAKKALAVRVGEGVECQRCGHNALSYECFGLCR